MTAVIGRSSLDGGIIAEWRKNPELDAHQGYAGMPFHDLAEEAFHNQLQLHQDVARLNRLDRQKMFKREPSPAPSSSGLAILSY